MFDVNGAAPFSFLLVCFHVMRSLSFRWDLWVLGSPGAGSHFLTKSDLLPVMIWEARLLENPEGILPSGQSWQGEKVT